MTPDVIVTDKPGGEVERAEAVLRGALTASDSLLAQLSYSVRFREYAHYLFMFFSALGVAAAATVVGPTHLLEALGSTSGLLHLAWALLSTRWGAALLLQVLIFWTLGTWAQRSMSRHFSTEWLKLAPRLRQALGVDRPSGVSATTRLEVTEEPHIRRKARVVSWAAVPATALLSCAWLIGRFFWCWAGDIGPVGMWFCHLSLLPALVMVLAGLFMLVLLLLRDLPDVGLRRPIPQPRLRRMRAGYRTLHPSHQTSILWAAWLFGIIFVALAALLLFGPLSLY